ncbi:MAG: extracellular solute-binding protein [Opitutales bacterium]|nr:extracellular solute-binding protein [Opitutales bacterium]
MRHLIWILLALALILGLPFALRTDAPVSGTAEDTVVVITPHPESIRLEFMRGFSRWYEEETGRTVRVDYRMIGGTSEISRFLTSEYTNAFRNHWEGELGRRWSSQIQHAFNNPDIELPQDPDDDNAAQQARRAFLESNVSSGIDVFFGGGSYDHSVHAARGHLVDAGLLDAHPEWFIETAEPGEIPSGIPQSFAGERFYDPEGRWHGAVLASYGIIYNKDVVEQLGLEHMPRNWADLTDPRYFGQIAVSDPTMSGAMTQAFEMVIQQQMQAHLEALREEHPSADPEQLDARAAEEGWVKGMQVIQLIAANARYFTDSSTKPNIDVSLGDSAAGMTIDFYGRFQQETIEARGGGDRFVFYNPPGGSTISADPISLLRGARNDSVARAYIRYVLSEEGQKLWNFKVGTPGGPETYALRRPPIRPDFYRDEWQVYRSDPDYNPYLAAEGFHYRGDWTGRLFTEIRFLIRVSFMDVRDELARAWKAILNARAEGRTDDADRALAVLSDLSAIDYASTQSGIRSALRESPLSQVQLARDLSRHFRDQYRIALRIANGQ